MNVAVHFYNEENKKKIRRYENNIAQWNKRIGHIDHLIIYRQHNNIGFTELVREKEHLEKEIKRAEMQIKKLKRQTF